MKQKEIKESLRKKNLLQSQKVDELRNSWNPLPVRGNKKVKFNFTLENNSNFINCKQKYMNMGKYKGVDIINVPASYLKWVSKNIELNTSELELIRKTLSTKSVR
jgi:uncharacterized protein (DUF3820 family)